MTDIPDFLPQFDVNVNPDDPHPNARGDEAPPLPDPGENEGGFHPPMPRLSVFAENVETDERGFSITTRVIEFTREDCALALHVMADFVAAITGGRVHFSDRDQRNRVLVAALDARDRFGLVVREGDLPT